MFHFLLLNRDFPLHLNI